MQTLLQDVRYALRSLLKRPGFALVAMLTIALGIGANTAIFSVVHAVLLSALPYRSADQLVTVWENNRKRGNDQNVINLGNFFDWKAQNQVFTVLIDRRVSFPGRVVCAERYHRQKENNHHRHYILV